VLLSAGSMALGEEIGTGYSFQTPTQSYLDRTDSVIAGSYLALGIVGSNPSQKTFNALQSSLQQTKQILETGTNTQKAVLTREKLLGDMFVTGVQGYYLEYIAQSKVTSLKSVTTLHQPMPMAGTYGYEPYQRTLFGINRGIEAFGMYMNVRTAQVIKDRAGNSDNAKQLMLQVGMLSSALESNVPELMFTDPNTGAKPEGFSTATALSMAAQQGQRIYTITQQNQATALSALHLDSLAMSEISDALATGKEVITHTDQLTVPGYKGSGYAIVDPVTGDGTYKISGGKNGGALIILGLSLMIAATALFIVSGATGIATAETGVGALAGVIGGLFAVGIFVAGAAFVIAGAAFAMGNVTACKVSYAFGVYILSTIAVVKIPNPVSWAISAILTMIVAAIGDPCGQ